jgi:hypothetical protein
MMFQCNSSSFYPLFGNTASNMAWKRTNLTTLRLTEREHSMEASEAVRFKRGKPPLVTPGGVLRSTKELREEKYKSEQTG